MEDLTPESRTIYELLKANTREEYEKRFLDHKKEILDAVREFVDDSNKQFGDLNVSLTSVQNGLAADLTETQATIGAELDAAMKSLSSEIAELKDAVDRAIRTSPSASAGGTPAPPSRTPADDVVGQGHGSAHDHRGLANSSSAPPPVGGMNGSPNFSSQFNSAQQFQNHDTSDSAPRVELPHFEGSNPKLWQRRSEEYFRRWNTPTVHWVAYATSQFTGPAATWLEAFLTQNQSPTWV